MKPLASYLALIGWLKSRSFGLIQASPPALSVGATTWLARVALEARAAAEKLLPEPPIEDMRLMETERLFVVSISPVALNMTGAALLKDIEHVESLWSVV